MLFLLPTYIVRREGNSFTLFVSSHLGGIQVSPAGGGGVISVQLGGGSGYSSLGSGSVSGGMGQVCQPGGGGSANLGQQKEYSLHGGWYASCVHAGELSCWNLNLGTLLHCICNATLCYFKSQS